MEAFYTATPANVPIANSTGVLTFVVWNGVEAESSAGFSGFRVRRTIHGVSPEPWEVAGQWLVSNPASALCLAQSQPCDPSDFVITGTGIFFHGFQNNARADGSYILDYPPSAPVDRCDSCWVFADLASLAGFRTDYTVTSIGVYDKTDYDETNIQSNEVVTITPGTPPPDNLERVAVVPNPFKGSAQWDPAVGEGRIHFIHIPSGSTVRIFTSSGELVRELKLDSGGSPGGQTGELSWDMRNGQDRKVVSGIYIYQVETPEGRTRKGHFVIIK